MSTLTFKEFLRVLDEDADADLANLNIKKQQLIVRKNAANAPLDVQVNNIDKQLMQKEKQKEVDDKKKMKQTALSNVATQAQANQTTTPGSTGNATPGQSPQISNTPRV